MRLNAEPGNLSNDTDNLLSGCTWSFAGALEKKVSLEDNALNYPLSWAAHPVVRAMRRYVHNESALIVRVDRDQVA
jgi:hypothetical protein